MIIRHYHSGEWRDYRLNKVSAAKRRRMEHHLARCDTCLQVYTAAVGTEEAAAAEKLLPADFTARVVQLAHRAEETQPSRLRRRLLLQYAAAASITLALTVGGFFEAAAREIPQMMRSLDRISREINRVAELKWSDKLAESASEQINYLLFRKGD
ncbi:MAG TPA: hypothetical protein PLY40_04420 [Bacillota bacterium]|nr:hypothetical protein [Bacillota bacterium]